MNTTNYQTDTNININHETDSDSDPILGGRGHRGKIGRLPRDLRHVLNVRLDDGEDTESILAWLNAEEEVQAMITGLFKGVPISAQNLSNWRRGGFQRWLKVQERLEFMAEWLEGSDELEVNESANELAGRLSKVLLAELALAVQEVLPTLTDPAERCEKIVKYLGMVTRVRQQEFVAQRLVREAEEREVAERQGWIKKAEGMNFQKLMMSVLTGKELEPVTAEELKLAGFPLDEEQLADYQAKMDADQADQTESGLNASARTRRKRTKRSLEPDAAAQPRPTRMPDAGDANNSIKINQGKADHLANGTDGIYKTDRAEADFGQDEQDGQDLGVKAGENSSIKVNQSL